MIVIYLLLSLTALADDPCQLLQVEEVEGEVTFRAGAEKELPLSAEDTLEAGETIITGADSWVDLRHCDGSAQRVGEKSEFTFEEIAGEEGRWSWAFSLLRGSVRALVNGAGEGEKVKFRLRTRTASLGVRGTEFVVSAEEAETSLHTLSGEVLMGSASDWEKLRAFKASHLARFQRVKEERFSQVRKGGRATVPKQFSPVRFQKERGKHLFRRQMRRTQGFGTLVPGKKAREVFQRNRSAIQRRMENRGRQSQDRAGERKAAPRKNRKAIQGKPRRSREESRPTRRGQGRPGRNGR